MSKTTFRDVELTKAERLFIKDSAAEIALSIAVNKWSPKDLEIFLRGMVARIKAGIES